MTLKLLKYNKKYTFNGSIKVIDESIDTRKLCSLYRVDDNGIYKLTDNINTCIFNYDFGDIHKVIYIRNYLFCINFYDGTMVRFDTLTNTVTHCTFPFKYTFYSTPYFPTLNKTPKGNLLTVGGKDTNISKLYNIDKDAWTECTPLPSNVKGHATVIDGHDIYVIGGHLTDKLIRYRNGEWTELQPLLHIHEKHNAYLYNKQIYVYGNKKIPEVYNISTDSCTTIDTNIFNDILADNSVYSESDRMFYMCFNNNIYTLSVENNLKTLLYENISVINGRSVLLDI